MGSRKEKAVSKEKFLLRNEDLRAIAELLENSYDNPKIRKRYSYILTVMADSMLSDDAIVVTESYFDREHGV